MKLELSQYRGMNICVAVSGGRDSMALLHYLLTCGAEFDISVCAINFDHGMRGESSARDSAFVEGYCRTNGVTLLFFEWNDGDIQKTEASAHWWRILKYAEAVKSCKLPDGTEWRGADAVATAHHLNDNAETVLFNLARGSGLSGLTGITDTELYVNADNKIRLIRPLVGCSRGEIDRYISENNIPYVDDETNFTDDYTRNKIRHNVLPELEKAVPNAAKAIYRFSRIAAEDEEYFKKLIEQRALVRRVVSGFEVAYCAEKPVFKRAVLQVLNGCGVKDYTFEHLEKLYDLQFADNGKKFEFLGLTAFKEDGAIAICRQTEKVEKVIPFRLLENLTDFGVSLTIGKGTGGLCFDYDKVPSGAQIRTRRPGDKFAKFGGGTKNLGEFLTDKKIPARMRDILPVIAVDNDVLAVCGVEISDKIKVDENTVNKCAIICDWQ